MNENTNRCGRFFEPQVGSKRKLEGQTKKQMEVEHEAGSKWNNGESIKSIKCWGGVRCERLRKRMR